MSTMHARLKTPTRWAVTWMLALCGAAIGFPHVIVAQQPTTNALASLRGLPTSIGRCEHGTTKDSAALQTITFLIGAPPEPNRMIRVDFDRSVGRVVRYIEIATRLLSNDKAIIESVGAALLDGNQVRGFFRRATGSPSAMDIATTNALTPQEQELVRALAAWVKARCSTSPH